MGWLCLLGTRAGEDGGDGHQENLEVEPEGPVVDVGEVEGDPFFEVFDAVAAGDLPEAGEAGFDAEAAALGVLGSLVLAAADGSLTKTAFWESLMGATRLSCMIMFILAASAFLTVTMGFTGVPRALAEWVGAMNLSPYTLIGVLCIIYILLGAALDGVSMIVLTTSIVLPMVQQAGFDLVWFGIFIVLLVEIAEVTPPVGFNLFVLQNMSGKSSMFVAQASLPFFFMMVLACVLITVFPPIVTWLPDVLMNK
jgi:tripartite ATP-independent transporter DctM subunit